VSGSTIPEGWTIRPTKAFGTLVGPFYVPPDHDDTVCGFMPDERHGNKRGVVHGGMIATAFDTALGNACWAAAGQHPCATVQLNVSFVGALALGQFARIEAQVMRTTRSLIFIRGVMTAGETLVGTADGVWKILTWRGEPPPKPS
jgi:acyl-coenzyme A thioesterase PaaI-like protein